MKKRYGTREAIVVTSLAAGFFFGAPLAADASEKQYLDPLLDKNYQFDTKKELRYGHTGYPVRFLQFELHKLNFYYETIDGHFGASTQEAVRRFQELYEIEVDGIAGETTLEKLNEVIIQPKPAFYTVGDEGPEVKQLQTKLQKLRFYNGLIDGKFESVTKGSVVAYQKKFNLEANGLATDETIDHIMKNKNVRGLTIKKATVVTAHPSPISTPETEESLPAETIEALPVDASVISIAMNYIGVPYVWGGTSPNGFDCSGFLQFVFAQKGVNISRTVPGIWSQGANVSAPSVGDIVFFQTYKPGPSHAGIYLGNNKFIHADSTDGISIDDMTINYWQSRYIGAKRL
ncbi:peptidoglycan-binding protein [Bacillus sp. REN16]|uniref:C40 family peptidase n=1 Tax=Bacillus sp. REN16 TaxID=2887296 RepID=UPI001E4222A9|nr:peptidoglycan-binding protein [Bacillus sp. REN16]MCC3358425.1 peptidoglycan-binding protein [Bacillus sp. REN16]